jgi:hypothetical protein
MFSQVAEAGKRHRKAVHLLEKSVINMIWLLLPGFDWPIIMIGPSGLLLVVSTYLRLLFQVYGWG